MKNKSNVIVEFVEYVGKIANISQVLFVLLLDLIICHVDNIFTSVFNFIVLILVATNAIIIIYKLLKFIKLKKS